MYKVPFCGNCSNLPTILMMSDCEEDLDDFPTFSEENINKPSKSLVGAFRAESNNEWKAASGITTKVPPLSDGSTSWLKYEELTDDWLDLTVLETRNEGQH